MLLAPLVFTIPHAMVIRSNTPKPVLIFPSYVRQASNPRDALLLPAGLLLRTRVLMSTSRSSPLTGRLG